MKIIFVNFIRYLKNSQSLKGKNNLDIFVVVFIFTPEIQKTELPKRHFSAVPFGIKSRLSNLKIAQAMS